MTQRSPELQKLVDSLAETIEYENIDILEMGGDHKYNCRCGLCLRFWVLVGPEEEGPGEWSFGPFTEEEFLAAGGVVPESTEDYEEEEFE